MARQADRAGRTGGKAPKSTLTRRQILALALVLSVALYLAGLFSGLSASNLAREQSRQDFSFLVGYVDTLENELGSLQIQEAFVNSLDETRRCEFAEQRFSQVAEQLNYYWSVFPTRLEEFERSHTLTPEYLKLKNDYTKLSLRAWIIARDNYERCNSDTIPILYFYNASCEQCPVQGEILDGVKKALQTGNKTVLAFTLDLDQDEPSLPLIKEYYNVTEAPAIIVNEHVLQGRLFSEAEITKAMLED